MWSFMRFGTICTIWKMWKTPMEECYFIACNFTKSNTACVFHVFKIVQVVPNRATHTAQKMKFSVKDFFSKCDQIWIWSHLLKKSLMENFIFCGVASHIHSKYENLLNWEIQLYAVSFSLLVTLRIFRLRSKN